MDANTRQQLYDNFDAEYWMDNETGGLLLEQKRFVSEWMFDLFSKGNIRGEKLLDIGTGPDINSVLYAYPYFEKIYLSDYSRNNRKYLQEWLNGNHSGRVRHYFEDAIKLEGSSQTPGKKEEELRNKIASILYCDVTQSNPICGNTQSDLGKFDTVIASWCLHAAVDTEEDYFLAVLNVASLIKPGGHLVLIDVSMHNGKNYINGVIYPSVTLSSKNLTHFLETRYRPVCPYVEKEYDMGKGGLGYAFNIALQIPE